MDIYLHYQEFGLDDDLLDEIDRLLLIDNYDPFHLGNKYSDNRLIAYLCKYVTGLNSDQIVDIFEYALVEKLGFVLGHLLESTSGYEFIWALENLRLAPDIIAKILVDSPKTLQLVQPYLGCYLVGNKLLVELPTVDDLLPLLDQLDNQKEILEILFGDDIQIFIEDRLRAILSHDVEEIVTTNLRNDLYNNLEILESVLNSEKE